jgi:phenylalanyl-tRNA synthetase beta chain
VPRFRSLSKFPSVRRDIAVIVAEFVTVDRLTACAQEQGGGLLREVLVFDLYRGQGVEEGKKSIALSLIWQDDAETLTDARVDEAVAQVVASLAARFDARLRD